MPLPLYHIDAFADEPLTGNPAAVVLLDKPADKDWMLHVAAEMNLSETAFVVRRPDAAFDLRWFTPRIEVELCGHATLASAHALWDAAWLPHDAPAHFHTASGLLTARRAPDNLIALDFPATPPQPDPHHDPKPIEAALHQRVESVWQTPYDLLVELQDVAAVAACEPNFPAIATLDARGLIITAESDRQQWDFVSRFFAPALGINEDPVTGSAHCALAPFWAPRLDKHQMIGRQLSQRGGTVRVHLADDRVTLAGHALTIARGQLFV